MLVLFCLGLNVGGFYMVEFIRMPISKLEGHCCERKREREIRKKGGGFSGRVVRGDRLQDGGWKE